MAMLIQHWLFVLGTWHEPYPRLGKTSKVVRQLAPELLSALAGERNWQRVTSPLVGAMQACRLNRRLKHPSHPQLLLDGLDWCLTKYLWAAGPPEEFCPGRPQGSPLHFCLSHQG